MADTLLHLTLAQSLRDSRSLHSDIRHLIAVAPEDYFLGAALIDLPYYENLFTNALRVAGGHPVIYNSLGNRFHDESAHALHCTFTDLAVTHAEKATVLGMWTHYATDLIFHHEIESIIRAAAQNNSTLSHRALEAQIGLHCHYEILGLSGEGDPYAARTLALSPQNSWIHFAQRAVQTALHIELAPSSLARWRTSLHLYGLLHSRRLPWVTWLPEDSPSLQQTSLRLYSEALAKSQDFVILAFQRMSGELSAAEFSRAIPICRLSDGTAVHHT